jgi:segregation and condensation protein A
MSAHIKIENFEGPLELLLELITSQKLEINQISLAQVTDQYLSVISDIEKVHPNDLADFLVIASTLILIKSRSLLPALPISPEEEKEIFLIEHRLKEYSRYFEAAKILRKILNQKKFIYTRELWRGFESGFYPPQNPPKAEDLAYHIRRIIEEFKTLFIPLKTQNISRIVTIEEKIKEILERVRQATYLTIEEIAGSQNKAELILAFLAILFLFRQKYIMLYQERHFGTIKIEEFKEENGSTKSSKFEIED